MNVLAYVPCLLVGHATATKVPIMLSGVNSVRIDINPVQDWSAWMIPFLIINSVILVGNLKVLSLYRYGVEYNCVTTTQ